jgi:hypothetical protein
MSLSSGAKLGPYEVVGPMGAGGMAESSKATRQSLRCLSFSKQLAEVCAHAE